MEHESAAENPPATTARADPIAVYVLGVTVGIGAMIRVGLFSYGGSTDLVIAVVAAACLVI